MRGFERKLFKVVEVILFMKEKVKSNTCGDWMIFWFLVILAIGSIWEGIPKSGIGISLAIVLWFAVIFEIFYILNKKKKFRLKKIKSKERHNKKNEIAGCLIVFFLGLFVWALTNWIVLFIWWLAGFLVINRIMKEKVK